MADLTKHPYDKVVHMAIDAVLVGIAYTIAITFGWHWLIAYGSVMRGYFREQAQEWHMCQRCNDAYIPWRWRSDSLKDWLSWSVVGIIGSITLSI